MTCGDKFNKNCPSGGTRVEPEEADGRPLCDHPGCGKRVIGTGERCADGHVQGNRAIPSGNSPATHSLPQDRATLLAQYAELVEQYMQRQGKRDLLFSPANVPGDGYPDGYYPPYVCLTNYDDPEHPDGLAEETVFSWPAVQKLPVRNDPAAASAEMLRQQVAALRVALAATLPEAYRIAAETGAQADYREADLLAAGVGTPGARQLLPLSLDDEATIAAVGDDVAAVREWRTRAWDALAGESLPVHRVSWLGNNHFHPGQRPQPFALSVGLNGYVPVAQVALPLQAAGFSVQSWGFPRTADGQEHANCFLLVPTAAPPPARAAKGLEEAADTPPLDQARATQGLVLKAGAHYPTTLPAELAPFYCYPVDGGHSLLVLPTAFAGQRPVEEYLVPIPVKTVLRLGWNMQAGVPLVAVEYDTQLGAVTPAEDEEW